MSAPFRPLSLFAGAPRVSVGGVAYHPGAAPAGQWPTPYGAPSRTSRSAEPLLTDAWSLEWEVELGEAARPDHLLVGENLIVVNGAEARRIWMHDGKATGSMPRGPGRPLIASLDRLLADDLGAGLSVYRLPAGNRDASILLAFPDGYVTRDFVVGPGLLVTLQTRDSPLLSPPHAVVQTLRVRDFDDKSALGILYGIEPLAGVVRDDAGPVCIAAAPAGPVLATDEGIVWCDWQLAPLATQEMRLLPLALSIDAEARAHLLVEREGTAHLLIVPPSSPAVTELALPWPARLDATPPLLTAMGALFLTPPGHLMALDAKGQVAWQKERSRHAAGTVSSNGLLIVDDGELAAFSPEGRRNPLWSLPAPLSAPPVLAGGRLHLATAERLMVLGGRS